MRFISGRYDFFNEFVDEGGGWSQTAVLMPPIILLYSHVGTT